MFRLRLIYVAGRDRPKKTGFKDKNLPVRTSAADDSVRAAMACPATSPMASPFSATGDPCPCFFATRCPSNFSRQLVHYGFAPDTGRASKHHSYEDHGSKPECPGLHDE